MPLGWIDFSKTERNKVLTVLDLLSENGTLDELGIATIRDGFSDLFFPGTSTIQTRAKYFFIVPYALRDLERSGETNSNQFLKALDDIERSCGEVFRENAADDLGIIGSRSLAGGNWVKRTPADIYWSGLRQYDIFRGGRLSLSEYARAVCSMKGKKSNLINLGNRNDKAEENEADDRGAGDIHGMHFWNIPTYRPEWFENLQMELTCDESEFIKNQIVLSCGDSMFAYALKHEIWEMLDCSDFSSLDMILHLFPEQTQKDYHLAKDFSEFNYVLRVVYNMVLSDEKNEDANRIFEELHAEWNQIVSIELESIFERTGAQRNPLMCKFLRDAKTAMTHDDVLTLKTLVGNREKMLKGTGRARCAHPGEFDRTAWFGGGRLGYRFNNAKTLMADIYAGEEASYVKSESGQT
ncbi:MAG: hypothetical protein GX963_02280 [Bacteroidales bacterium]|nr:hypothetical protein [Bacteroidales bacterium]